MSNWYTELKLGGREQMMGKTLLELGYGSRYVNIIRACHPNVMMFNTNDYVCVNKPIGLKFVKEHAEHMAAVEEEKYQVIKAMVKSDQVKQAGNPEEWFYIGLPVAGKTVYWIEPDGRDSDGRLPYDQRVE